VKSTGFRTIPTLPPTRTKYRGIGLRPYDEGSALPWTQVGGTSLAVVDGRNDGDRGSRPSVLWRLNSQFRSDHTDLYSVDSTKPSDFHESFTATTVVLMPAQAMTRSRGWLSNGSQLVPDLSTFGLFVNVASIAITPSNPALRRAR